ncbi:MAG: hypothetical protein ACFFDN_26205 [Candidatus Hodarchaeota archaeon]
MVRKIIENKNVFIYGIVILTLAVVALFIPNTIETYYFYRASSRPYFFSYFYFFNPLDRLLYFASLLLINAGALLVMGGIWESENLTGTGFGIGLGGCSLFIGPCVYSLIMHIHDTDLFIGNIVNLCFGGVSLVLVILSLVDIEKLKI